VWGCIAFAILLLPGKGGSTTSPEREDPERFQATSNPLAKVAIGDVPGAPIQPSFMGIAHEWGDAQSIMGSSDGGVNAIYRNLLRNLTAYGSGPIIIRIGGNSTDTSNEPTSATVLPFAEVASAIGAHFYLGVNLGAGNLQLAVKQAKAFAGGMPAHSLDAIEIGNEPDSYVDKRMRSAPYPFSAYLTEFDTWRKQIYPLLPNGTQLIGPAWAYPASLSNSGPFLEAEHSYVAALSQHYYSGDVGHGKVNPPDFLLKPNRTSEAALRIRAGVATAHGYHVAFRVDELNSLAGGGQDGVSNTFGAALWAIDIMFEFANVGVDGVNWQSPNGAAYSPLSFNIARVGSMKSYQIKSVNPLYYGMLLFQAATGNQAHLLPVSLTAESSLKAWATLDSTGKQRLVVVNKGVTTETMQIVHPGYRTASILRLTASSPASKTGVSFAGQTMDGSVDGRLQGTKQVETVKSGAGVFEISAPASSALIAEFVR
jgi:hypothetical protein